MLARPQKVSQSTNLHKVEMRGARSDPIKNSELTTDFDDCFLLTLASTIRFLYFDFYYYIIIRVFHAPNDDRVRDLAKTKQKKKP